MLRLLCKRMVILGAIIPVIPIDREKFESYQKARGVYLQSGWERVKIIFKKDDMAYNHPDLKRAFEKAQVGFLVGGLWGGIIGSKKYSQNFLNNNDATLFHNNKDAMTQLARRSLMGTVIEGFKVGSVFAAFMGGFTLFTSCLQAYTLRDGFTEYILGGSIIGSLFRFHFGFRGMIIGGIVGGALGGMYGAVEISLSKLLNKTPTELKYLISSYKKEVADKALQNVNKGNEETKLNVDVAVQNTLHLPDKSMQVENKK